ncbi:SDR family oxidoreductase [Rhodobacter sp. SGA-6-6]|uniref:SDR family oxidoreductase n=1 Tax=Rhodobacter sp. SGA-6-6 TaxID=2710882 RepID=UPI0013EA89C4|nr:SDR family oxidoreductase [Rhodobacter sp. SGA-6-6]NGM45293.1 SDR family oxidoreductase [Rhodobacter sp. SGA-6-6]
MLLKDKVFIITGASSGIGAAAADLFARNGAAVVLGARRERELATVADRIVASGGRAVPLPGDVTEAGYAEALVARAQSEFGGLDGAFNNAGRLGSGRMVAETPPEEWAEVLATNLTSACLTARAQLPALVARGGGSLIFTGSFIGHTATLPGMGCYAASKAGLVGLVQAIAVEYGAQGVRANALLPGGTMTAMAGDAATNPDAATFIAGLHALKRIARPEEIAKAALFLASDMASFVTGTAMLADGGNSICKV